MGYTSTEVKRRWNAQHYEQMSIVVPIGSRALIQARAEELGLSTSAYIRQLIARDAPDCLTVPQITGGGTTLVDFWSRL